MLDRRDVAMYKVKFRVFETKQHGRCRKVHPMPSHRIIFHQGEGTEYDVAQQGHQLAVFCLNAEYRAERRALKKEGQPMSMAVIKRPLFQYTVRLSDD